MQTRFVVTATGTDRPGIVAAVAAALSAAGWDIEDSAMTNLGGRFAMILAVSRPEETPAADPAAALAAPARDFGLSVHVDAGGAFPAGGGAPRDAAREAVSVSVSGANRLGIVARVAAALADREINIVDLSTRLLTAGPVPVYLMRIDAEAERIDLEALRRACDEAGRDLGVDVRIERLQSVEL